MRRVLDQGDLRPVAASPEAMGDLRRILEGRAPFYAKADATVDTSAGDLDSAFAGLRAQVRRLLALPE